LTFYAIVKTCALLSPREVSEARQVMRGQLMHRTPTTSRLTRTANYALLGFLRTLSYWRTPFH
jgi:hypothetical protein